ncbi:MAG: YihY/virulence factor BrkB family protein [Anaerolineales bacterium]|jgi:membrane protein
MKRIQPLLELINEYTRGAIEIAILTIRRFGEARAAENAASLAYYTLFSIFPLFLAIIAAGSFLLERREVYQQVQSLITEAFPVARGLIQDNLDTVLQQRGTVGAIGIIGLTWSATGVFSNLIFNINRAWPKTKPRNFIRKRLAGFGIVALLAILLALSTLGTTVVNLLARVDVPTLESLGLDFIQLRAYMARLISWGLKLFVFIGLFLWAPNTRVPFMAAFWGAFLAATGWELGTAGFTWYLTSGIPRYELVYGSLGTVVVLMLWIYISMIIVLLGAHLGAAYVFYQDKERNTILSSLFE